ncbi:MAG: ABC transporter substrate-binding protein [Armatimonadota bacterium]
MRRALLPAVLASVVLNTGCTKVQRGAPLSMPDDGSGGEVALRFSVVALDAPPYAEAFEKFHAQQDGIRVSLEPIPAQGYLEKLKVLIANGEAPDVFVFDDEPFLALQQRGAFLDLTPYIEEDDFDLDRFWKTNVELCTVDGRVYGLPMDGGAEVLYYNKDLFDAAGLDYPSSEWTWDDFVDAAKALTRDTDGDGITDQYGYLCTTDWWPKWLPWIWMCGGRVLNDDRTECLMDSPEAIAGLRWYSDLMLKHEVAPLASEGAMTGMGRGQLFGTGRVAMFGGLPVAYREFKEYRHINWDVCPYPIGPKGVRITRYTGCPYVIYARTKHPRECWMLLKFLEEPEIESIIVRAYKFPVQRAVAESDVWLNPRTPWHEEVFTQAVADARVQPLIPEYDEMGDLVQDELDRLIAGRQSAEETGRNIKRRVDRLLMRDRTAT